MNDLNRSIKIFIDGTEASAGVKKIEDAISQLKNKISIKLSILISKK